MRTGKIFVSYSRSDGGDFALKLATDLRNAGVDAWIDQLDIQPGSRWNEEIQNALQEAWGVLFIASTNSLANNNVMAEVYYALDQGKEVIPVIIHRGCKLPWRLSILQYIDFTNDYQIALKRLLQSFAANPLNALTSPTGSTDSAKALEPPNGSSAEPDLQRPGKNAKVKIWMIAIALCIGIIASILIVKKIANTKENESEKTRGLTVKDKSEPTANTTTENLYKQNAAELLNELLKNKRVNPRLPIRYYPKLADKANIVLVLKSLGYKNIQVGAYTNPVLAKGETNAIAFRVNESLLDAKILTLALIKEGVTIQHVLILKTGFVQVFRMGPSDGSQDRTALLSLEKIKAASKMDEMAY